MSNMVNKVKSNDVFVRAFKTWWQGALAYLVMALPTLNISLMQIFTEWEMACEFLQTTGLSLLCGAIAAGISAVWNSFVKPYALSLKAKNQSLGLTAEELGVTEESMAIAEESSDECYTTEEFYEE